MFAVGRAVQIGEVANVDVRCIESTQYFRVVEGGCVFLESVQDCLDFTAQIESRAYMKSKNRRPERQCQRKRSVG